LESREVKLEPDEHADPMLIFSEHIKDLDKMWRACNVHKVVMAGISAGIFPGLEIFVFNDRS
jgi:hypothetical protein